RSSPSVHRHCRSGGRPMRARRSGRFPRSGTTFGSARARLDTPTRPIPVGAGRCVSALTQSRRRLEADTLVRPHRRILCAAGTAPMLDEHGGPGNLFYRLGALARCHGGYRYASAFGRSVACLGPYGKRTGGETEMAEHEVTVRQDVPVRMRDGVMLF